MILAERNIQITVDGAIDAWKFDDNASHLLSHCMKAVDFIVEFDDRYMFIEVKDPQHPNARDSNQAETLRSFQSGEMDRDFQYKYRDSFLYEWASGRADKPIYYFILFAWDALDSATLHRRTDALRRDLPVGRAVVSWNRPIAYGCGVFNIDTWNQNLPQYPVTRLT